MEPALRSFAFVCNDRAGSGRRRDALDEIIQRLEERGHRTSRFPCQVSPESTAWSAIRGGYNVIVAVGGDGTVSGCAAAVWKNKRGTLLGVIPTGTLNHFAKDVGIPNLATAVDALCRGLVRHVDIATVNGIPFVNNSGIGLYPVIVRKREGTRRAGVPRWVAFVIAMLRVASRLPVRKLELEIAGHRDFHRTPFLFIGNNAYRVEGLDLGTRARMDAGVLGIYASRAAGLLPLVRMAFRALLGRIRQERDFLQAEASQLIVRSPHASLQISLDGELRRVRVPLEYRSLPGALPLIAPPPASPSPENQG